MKDLSLFLAKNSLGAKIRKGLRTFCNDDGSTSTLNHNQADKHSSPSSENTSFYMEDKKHDHGLLDDKVSESSRRRRRRRKSPPASSGTTLEDMILKLEMEEKQQEMLKWRVSKNKSKLAAENVLLMSARDALSIQYPRFSLDGRDAMYRSCFRRSEGRRSVCCDYRSSSSVAMNGGDRVARFDMVGGQRVVWCKPGVVAKLMGLDALPMPFKSNSSSNTDDVIRSSSNSDQRRRLLVLGTTSTSTKLP